jgi:hypothetical protein
VHDNANKLVRQRQPNGSGSGSATRRACVRPDIELATEYVLIEDFELSTTTAIVAVASAPKRQKEHWRQMLRNKTCGAHGSLDPAVGKTKLSVSYVIGQNLPLQRLL